MKSEFPEEYDDENTGYDATVLDFANIELLDVEDGEYKSENGNFYVTREREDRFVLLFNGHESTFSSSNLLIEHLKQ